MGFFTADRWSFGVGGCLVMLTFLCGPVTGWTAAEMYGAGPQQGRSVPGSTTTGVEPGLPAEQVSRVAQVVTTADEIEDLAVQVRAAWGLGLGPIGNMVNLLESRGVLVTHIPEGCEDVDAFSTWHEGRPVVFLVMEKGSTSRTRFDACHELGHLVMHADATPGSPDLERQANRFASAFLLPREPFLMECPRWLDWDHFYELKRRWKVSVAAMVKRAYDLGKLSEATYRRAYVHLNKTGERTQERDEPPAEPPTLLGKALAAVEPEVTVEALAATLGVGVGDLRGLVNQRPEA